MKKINSEFKTNDIPNYFGRNEFWQIEIKEGLKKKFLDKIGTAELSYKNVKPYI